MIVPQAASPRRRWTSPIRNRPNVLLTPHVPWYSEVHMLQLKRPVAEEAVRVLRGEPPRYCVNPAYCEHAR